MYGLDPFSAQKATSSADPAHAPSIFGALPYPEPPSSVTPPLSTLVTFRFTSLHPTVLDCKVAGPNNETCFRVVTAGQEYTLLKDRTGNDVALVAWQHPPTVEAQNVTARQPVGQWLQLSADRRCVLCCRFGHLTDRPVAGCSARTMVHGGVQYAWAPLGRFLHVGRISHGRSRSGG